MATEIRPGQQAGVDVAGSVDVAGYDDDAAPNLAGALAATVRRSAGQMPQDTPLALVYRLAASDETAPR